MSSFLASVEKQAFVIAKLSTQEPESALDIVQDTMYRMVKNYSGKPPSEWSPLFFRILSNRISDHHRKTGVFGRMTRIFASSESDEFDLVEEPIHQLESIQPLPDQELQNDQLGKILKDTLQNLPDRQQQAFTLRMWQDLSIEQTAIAMSVSTGSVKTHLHRALQALKSRLKEYQST